jgi:hypothetical protein
MASIDKFPNPYKKAGDLSIDETPPTNEGWGVSMIKIYSPIETRKPRRKQGFG